MSSDNLEAPKTSDHAHKSFFRDSGWLMIANIAGGLLNYGIHFLPKAMPKEVRVSQYGLFGVFLSVAMVIPTLAIQMAITHQTALALATNRQRELTRLIRRLLLGTFTFWVLIAILTVTYREQIYHYWQIPSDSHAGLWVTLVVVLLSFWMPLFWGVLQGQQNFFSLGWSMMINGGGRLVIGVIAVIIFGGLAGGMMVGVALGMVAATGMAAWQTRALWKGPSAPFAWRGLAREAIPPMFGFMAFQFLFTADQMFVKAYFSEDQAGFYLSAGTLSRAMMWLVLPLASVMFPKIVHSRAKSEKSNLAAMVLGGTALLAILGAAGLVITGSLIVQIVYGKQYVPEAMSLLPWYAGAMVPLAVANVLLSTLLARSAFKVVLPVCVVAVGYGFTLSYLHGNRDTVHWLGDFSPVVILKTLGIFNLLLLAVCGLFSWMNKDSVTPVNPEAIG